MRLFRSLTLLLTSLSITVLAPMAFADDTYQVEMILVRQNAVPAIVSRAAPEDWPPAPNAWATTACARLR